jgi:hypothetical protein
VLQGGVRRTGAVARAGAEGLHVVHGFLQDLRSTPCRGVCLFGAILFYNSIFKNIVK